MRTTLDWFGCATFRLKVGELVVFLDAYIDRLPGAPGTGLRADDVDRADWVVVGHSHFDHLWGAERIARQTGATVIGSHETVRVMESEGVPMRQLLPVAGGERVRLSDAVIVSVFPSLHSCVWAVAPGDSTDGACIGDLGLTYQERSERFAQLGERVAALDPQVLAHLRASNQRPRGDGGAFVYLFETPDGTLLYQDTSGHWSGILRDLRPDMAILAAAGRGNVDGEPIQGSLSQFVARQARLLKAHEVVLSHHDDWLPGFSSEPDTGAIGHELSRSAPRARLVSLDYMDGYPLFV